MAYQSETIAMSIENFNDVTESRITERNHVRAYSTDLTLVSDIEMETVESDTENSKTESIENESTNQCTFYDNVIQNEQYIKPLSGKYIFIL